MEPDLEEADVVYKILRVARVDAALLDIPLPDLAKIIVAVMRDPGAGEPIRNDRVRTIVFDYAVDTKAVFDRDGVTVYICRIRHRSELDGRWTRTIREVTPFAVETIRDVVVALMTGGAGA